MAASSRVYPPADPHPARLRFPVTSRYILDSLEPDPTSLTIAHPAPEAAEWEMVVPRMIRPPLVTQPEPEIESAANEPSRRSLHALTIFWLLILALTAAAVIFLKTHV